MDATEPYINTPEPDSQMLIPSGIDGSVLELPAQTQSLIDMLPKHRADAEPKMMKARQFAGRVVLAAVCTIPVADLALSDAVSLKVLQVSQDVVQLDSPKVERVVENGIVGLDIMLESMLVGAAITRSRKLKGVFGDMEEYSEKRRNSMSRPRRLLSDVANAPYNALGYISEKFEKLGEKVAARKSRAARVLGKLAVDTGKVNAIGTSGIILQETLAGDPPDLKRNAWLAGLIATTWVGTAEAIRALHDNVPPLQKPLDIMGKTFETLTTPDNPLSISVLGAVGLGLASSGWNIAKFHESKETEPKELGLPDAK